MRSLLQTFRLRCLPAGLLLVATMIVNSRLNAADEPKKTESFAGLSWLLPKGLQKNPELELTVVTEVTGAGKKLRPVSTDQPAYFQIHSTGYKQLGDTAGGEKTLPAAEIEAVLVQSLAANGYLPVKAPGQPFSLVIVYGWGTHNTLAEGDAENPVIGREQMVRNFLDRAAMVGGLQFARELRELLQQAEDLNTAANAQLASGGEPPIPASVRLFANPVNLFKLRNAKNETLLTQAANDVYYVVASAYDARSVVENKRVLLWRTRMTVGSNGVSQAQGLPMLIRSAAPFFGRETDGAEILFKRGLREGKVDIGPATVIEDKK